VLTVAAKVGHADHVGYADRFRQQFRCSEPVVRVVSIIAACNVSFLWVTAYGVKFDGAVDEVDRDVPAACFDATKREGGERVNAKPLLHVYCLRYPSGAPAVAVLYVESVDISHDRNLIPQRRHSRAL
jgi:hypothetical protein